jgi:hypothetical protein
LEELKMEVEMSSVGFRVLSFSTPSYATYDNEEEEELVIG